MEINEKQSGLAYSLSAIMPFIFQLFALLFTTALAGIINKVATDMTSSQAFKWVLLALNQLAFFWCVYYIMFKSKSPIKTTFGIEKKGFLNRYLILGIIAALGLMFLMSPIVGGFVEILKSVGYVQNESALPKEFTWYNYLLGFIILCVMPAIIEEMLFRGLILRGMKGFGTVFAIIMSSVFFTLMHQNIEQVLHQFLFALMLSYIVIKTKSILIPVLLHFINNFLALTFTYVAIPDILSYVLMGIGGVAVLLCVLFEFVLKKPQKEIAEVRDGNKKTLLIFAIFGLLFNIIMLIIGVFA